MDPRLLMALQLLQSLPSLIAAGAEVTTLIQEQSTKLQDMANTGRKPTDQEWDELNAKIDALRGQLHQG